MVEQKGIYKSIVNNTEYIVWANVNVVDRYIKDYLKRRYPGKLLIKELNDIDYIIPEHNLPVEIQSTIIGADNRPNRMSYDIRFSMWENVIRKQIDQDIIYGKCLFFFDSELLRAMKDSGKNISINMDWFLDYMREGKLEVFTVSHNGIIEEKAHKDFDFLANVSQTIGTDDKIILNKNKIKIFNNIINGYRFIQEEIDKFDDDYEKYCKINKNDSVNKIKPKISFLEQHADKRSKMYGYILQTIGTLPSVNDLILDRKWDGKTMSIWGRKAARILGIFDIYGNSRGNTCSSITKFVDRFDVCKYFPGYLRNKEMWDKLRGCNLNWRQFENVVTGKNDVIRGLDYYFNDKNLDS